MLDKFLEFSVGRFLYWLFVMILVILVALLIKGWEFLNKQNK